MIIEQAKSAGFCFGVERAVKNVKDLISRHTDARIYTLGSLIHNPHVLAEFSAAGVRVLSSEDQLSQVLQDAQNGIRTVIVIRTHGVPRSFEQTLRATENTCPTLNVIDCTCPFVKKIHRIAYTQSQPFQNTPHAAFGLIFGDETHPEVAGIRSYFFCPTKVFSDFTAFDHFLDAHAAFLQAKKRLILVSQTTQSLTGYKKCQKKLKKLYTNANIFDTICSVTEDRQLETAALAKRADLMFVVGGKNSSNTQKLFQISQQYCPDSFLIEGPDKVPCHLLAAHNFVGITAGASTPRDIIEEVRKTMSEQNTNEQSFAQMLDESFKTLNTGDIVKGVITSITPTEIHVDIGSKVTGILSFDDVTDDPSADVKNMYKVGDMIEAVAFRVSDIDGTATLSKKRVDHMHHWQDIVKAKEEGTVLTGKIVETMEKGVLIYVCGTKVFVPASQSGLPRGADMAQLMGTTQRVKIIEINEQRRRAVASIREVLQEEQQAQQEAFWENIEVGKHYDGVVKSFMPYGAFVDLGGVDGMVHTSELSWRHIKHPSAVIQLGDHIDVFVKDFDPEKKRISLGYKTEEMNPWKIFTDQYQVGDVASVKIVNMMPFGAFAEIIPGVDGLIHISQIADHRIASPAEVLQKGQLVDAKIVGIDMEAQKVSLSIRALLEDADNDAYYENEAEESSDEAEANSEAVDSAENAVEENSEGTHSAE